MASPCVVPTQKRLLRSGLIDSTTPESGPVRSTGIVLPAAVTRNRRFPS